MHAYNILRWVVAVPLGLLGGWIIVLNFVTVYLWYARREHHSFVPLLGGGLAFLGMGVCPLPQVEQFAWIPLAVDAGYLVATLTVGLVLRCFTKGKKDEA